MLIKTLTVLTTVSFLYHHFHSRDISSVFEVFF